MYDRCSYQMINSLSMQSQIRALKNLTLKSTQFGPHFDLLQLSLPYYILH